MHFAIRHAETDKTDNRFPPVGSIGTVRMKDRARRAAAAVHVCRGVVAAAELKPDPVDAEAIQAGLARELARRGCRSISSTNIITFTSTCLARPKHSSGSKPRRRTSQARGGDV